MKSVVNEAGTAPLLLHLSTSVFDAFLNLLWIVSIDLIVTFYNGLTSPLGFCVFDVWNAIGLGICGGTAPG